jgi:hypothetical protein
MRRVEHQFQTFCIWEVIRSQKFQRGALLFVKVEVLFYALTLLENLAMMSVTMFPEAAIKQLSAVESIAEK